jgi:regulator of protease activity HflC (stomatin/prohibitin superfamily)
MDVYVCLVHLLIKHVMPFFFSLAMALLVRAKADAEAEVLRSDAHKDAEILRAEGVMEAAKLIESSQVAINLETIKASAMAIKDSDKFFFGQHPSYIPKMLNSDMV